MGNIPSFFVCIFEVYGIETCTMSYNKQNMDWVVLSIKYEKIISR